MSKHETVETWYFKEKIITFLCKMIRYVLIMLLFGNAYYKCHLSALPGTLPSLRHVNRDCSVSCFTPQPCFLPTLLGERRDSVISTCASSGPTRRISTGWLMLGLFNISEFTFCKLSFSSRSAYLPTHTETISSCSRPRCLAILAFLNSVGKWTTCPLNSVSHTNIACKKSDTTLRVKIVPKIGKMGFNNHYVTFAT